MMTQPRAETQGSDAPDCAAQGTGNFAANLLKSKSFFTGYAKVRRVAAALAGCPQ